MNALSMSLTAVLSLALMTTACVGGDEGEGEFAGADAGGFASVADAAPAPVVPDADIPDPDPDPDPDPNDLPIDLACSLDDVQPILECVSENCLDSIADDSLLTCVTLNCGLLLLTTPPECTQCLFAAISDPSSALDACVSGLDDFGGGGSGGGGGFPIPPFPQP